MRPLTRTALMWLWTACPSFSQPFTEGLIGQNPGDRSASALTFQSIPQNGAFGGCGYTTLSVVSSPGWNADVGRVDLWHPPDLNPTWRIVQTYHGVNLGDRYGSALTNAGNPSGDGLNDLVMGAPGTNGGAGLVEVVAIGDCDDINNSRPRYRMLWSIPGANAGDEFGYAVAIMDDINGDGCDEVLVGAPNRDRPLFSAPPIVDAGALYVLSGADGSLIRRHQGGTTSGHLGHSVAVIGDIDGDGKRDYVVGEPGFHASAGAWIAAGRVSVYSGLSGASITAAWTEGPKAGSFYGWSVANAGDANQDGTPDYVVGAPAYDYGSPFSIIDTGYVAVCSGVDGAIIYWTRGPGGSQLGKTVDGGNDILNEGYPAIIAGGPDYDSGRGMAQVVSMRRQAVVYSMQGSLGSEFGTFVDLRSSSFVVGMPGYSSERGTWRTYQGLPSGNVPGLFPSYGTSVALLGDVDGDGWDDFAAGQYDTSVTYVAPLWDIYSGRTTEVLHSFGGAAVHGHQLAGIGDVNGDGTRDIANAKPEEGIVQIRDGRSPSTVLRTHTDVAGTGFGHVLADVGDVNRDGVSDYAVGQPGFDGGFTNAGRVTIFSGANGTVLRTHDGAGAGHQLGASVAGLGDVNGDGVDDYGAGAPYANSFIVPLAGRAYAWSGLDGSEIWSMSGAANFGNLGRAICGPGDVDGDGFADIVVAEPFWGVTANGNHGRVHVIQGGPAGSAHATIRTHQGTYDDANAGFALAAIGDADRDGVGDYAYSYPRLGNNNDPGGLAVISAASGSELYRERLGYYTYQTGWALAGRPGMHADGRMELIVGAPSTGPQLGEVRLRSFPRAVTNLLGSGCGLSPSLNQPELSMTRPFVGQLATLSLQNVPPSGVSPVVLYFSDPVTTSLPLGSGCELWLNPWTLAPLVTLPGNFDQTFYLENDASLAGFDFQLQGVALAIAPTPWLLMTNGLYVNIGF